ncbi:hypothetical protein ACFODL_10260 [Phenylobacterium terrae]|uniref:Chemotaxis protein CheA n=1 Tax=Phenylobacterium terrae TaxID=2665495 RepID=A0ABW4MYS6_9CAUL
MNAAVPSADIFGALALELERAGELCDQLETVMARLVEASGSAAPEDAMRDAQAVDALGQTLRGLAGFVETLSQQGKGPVGYDVAPALKTITLAALAARLAAETGQASGAHGPGHEEGELQLF